MKFNLKMIDDVHVMGELVKHGTVVGEISLPDGCDPDKAARLFKAGQIGISPGDKKAAAPTKKKSSGEQA